MERKPATEGLPVIPSPATLATPERRIPQDVQELSIDIANGHFDADVYTTQTGPTRLKVTAHGGPYTFRIDPLVAPRQLPANTTTQIDLSAPDPGRRTMRLSGGGAEATATLDVRPIGGR